MTGAMYAAIAGLKTHMSKLSVIGNNVANVNTNAYKSQRAVFRDSLYTMYSSGADGTTTVGGKNPSQIGYGSRMANIDLNMTSSNFAPGNPMDCMLYGDGFFLVGDKDVADVIDATNPTSFKSLTLTRLGDFKFDDSGYLTDGTGKCVYGFMTVGTDPEGNPIVSDQLVPIRLPRMERVAAYLTATDGHEVGDEVQGEPNKDTEGTEWGYTYKVRYPVVARDGAGADAKPVTGSALLGGGEDAADTITHCRLDDYWPAQGENEARPEVNPLPFAQLDSISISTSTGRISGTLKDTDQWVSIGFLAVGNVTNPNGVSHTGESYYTCGDGAGDLQISMLGGAAETLQTVGGGKLSYVNGSLAPAADANADAAAELSDKAAIGSAGTTTLYSGGLETSNVDLATEISEMITTQRGYQANTRIITVTDSMLEELVNMKR